MCADNDAVTDDISVFEDKRAVTQGNELTRAAYSMSPSEKRLLMLAIAKVNPAYRLKDELNGLIRVQITVQEWKDLYGSQNPYPEMVRAAESLQGISVTLNPFNDKKDRRRINLTDSCDYMEGEGRIVLVFGASMCKLLLRDFINQFTYFDLLSVNQLTSTNAIRLYELLVQFRKTGRLSLTFDELRTLFQTGDSYRDNGVFKRWVIEASITQINQRTDIEVVYTTRKKGVRLHAVDFTFGAKQQPDLFQGTEAAKKNTRAAARSTEDKRASRKRVTAAVMNIQDTDW